MRWLMSAALAGSLLFGGTVAVQNGPTQSAATTTPVAVVQATQPANYSNTAPADDGNTELCELWGWCPGDRNGHGNPTDCDIWGNNCSGDDSIWGTPLDQCDIWGNCHGQRDGFGNPICTFWGCPSTNNNDWWWGRSSSDGCSFYGNCNDSKSRSWGGGTGWGNKDCAFRGTCDDFGW